MPLSEKDVVQMISRLPLGGKFVGRREVKELPKILWDDEQVLDLVQGFYNNGTGILVATQKRLLFVDKGMLGGLKVEDFPLDKNQFASVLDRTIDGRDYGVHVWKQGRDQERG